MPIDLVPGFLPIVGYMDDVVAIVILLGGAVRAIGLPTIEKNWPGTQAGLRVLARLCGINR